MTARRSQEGAQIARIYCLIAGCAGSSASPSSCCSLGRLSEDRTRGCRGGSSTVGVLLQFGLALLFLTIPAGAGGVSGAEPRRRGAAERDRGRDRLCLRLSRRRPIAVCRDAAGGQLYLRLSRIAAGAGDQRARHAVVLLGRAAAHRAGIRLGLAAHGRDRRPARPRRCRTYLRRSYRGAAVDPPLSDAARARRVVCADELRHGRDRRHGHGALRLAGRVRPFPTRSAIS